MARLPNREIFMVGPSGYPAADRARAIQKYDICKYDNAPTIRLFAML